MKLNTAKRIITSILFYMVTIAVAKKHKHYFRFNSKFPTPASIEECSCDATIKADCNLRGDPHLKSFYNLKKFVKVIKNAPLNIYSYDNFNITATTFGPDLMDEIKFGDYTWHKKDCKGKKGFLDPQSHTYSDGSTMEGRVYCNKSRKDNKIHLNLEIIKSITLKDNQVGNSFEEHELEIQSSGLCNKKF